MKRVLFFLMAMVIIAVPAIAQQRQLVELQLPKNDKEYSRWFRTNDWACEVYVLRDESIMTLALANRGIEYDTEQVFVSMGKNGKVNVDGTLRAVNTIRIGPEENLPRASNGELFRQECLTTARRDLPDDVKIKFYGRIIGQ